VRNLFAEYIFEREGFHTYEDERGFMTYKITGKDCYIRDMFIARDFRNTGACKELADKVTEIAKINGCTRLLGTIVPILGEDMARAQALATESMRLQIVYGFKIIESNPNQIVLAKEI